MLSISSVRTKKTKIMYRANLSFLQVDKYLKVLLESGLLEHDLDSGYLITEKGMEFLKFYKEYQKRSEHLREEIGRNIEDRRWLEKMSRIR